MATSVTIEVLCQHLEDFGWKRYKATPEPLEQEGLIFTGYIGEKDQRPHTVIIDPMVEKGVLRIFSPDVASAPPKSTPRKRLRDLTYTIACLNARSVLAQFGYDPSGGEVVVSVSMPIEENDISFEQFRRAMEAVIWGVNTYGPGLRDIIAGKSDPDKVLKSEETGDLRMLAQLMRELEERLGGGRSDSSDEEEEEQTETEEEEPEDTDEKGGRPKK